MLYFFRLSDYTRDTKTILLLANIVQATGNFMYFMGINAWFLVASRFVAGKIELSVHVHPELLTPIWKIHLY